MTSDADRAGRVLDIATISRADRWIDDVLPRFAGMIDACHRRPVRKHLLLVAEEPHGGREAERVRRRLAGLFDRVVARPAPRLRAGARLLDFDALRAGLVTDLGLREVLYIDADTDVVEDLGEVLDYAPAADLLWVANPLLLEPIAGDLVRHGYAAAGAPPAALIEPGFLHLRRDFSEAFAALVERHPDVHPFAPGSTYWNMLAISLGDRARRLPDRFNRTFWDVSAAAAGAKSVHFTGHWKRLQPFVEYDRPARRVVIRDRPVAHASPWRGAARPDALNVIMLVRDNVAWLPHAFSRFAAWERAGVRCRYHVLENDSTDGTAEVAAAFLRGRVGRLESRSLAIRTFRTSAGTNYDRIMPLARMRNHVTDIAMAAEPPAPDEWTLLLDSGIHFPEDVLDRVFAAASRDPRPDSLGMITVYTQQVFDAARASPLGDPVEGMPGRVTAGHYFDTYAFQTLEHLSHHPLCAFARCGRCAIGRSTADPRATIPADVPIVDVASAFGGFALVPTALLRDSRLRWATHSMGIDRSLVLSEHVVFCDRLRTLTGRRVVVLQDVDCVLRL